MKSLLQPEMKRGRVAERAALALFLALLTVLFVSVAHGVLWLGS
jgi:hypothetical protein